MTKSQTIKNKLYLGALMMLATLAMMAMLLTAAGTANASTTFTVNRTGDSSDTSINGVCDADFATGNQCTLRAAIQEANDTIEEDTIDFNIPKALRNPSSGVATISPDRILPSIIHPVTINGFSQPGSSSNTLSRGTNARLKVQLDGGGVTGSTDPAGLQFANTAGFSFVSGLVINRFDTGVEISAEHVILTQNFIGTDPTGTLDRGNLESGVSVQGLGNSVGLTFPEGANLISGNDGAGVSIGSQASSTSVSHNLIGTDRSGTKDLGNARAGVEITDSSNNNTENNTIGFNSGDGVSVEGGVHPGFEVSTNVVLANSIFSNGGIGINLIDPGVLFPEGESDGPTANDPGDADLGPNGLQNKPVLTSATSVSGKTTIKGKLGSHPGEPYTIQFFSNPSGDEGKKFLEGRRRLRPMEPATPPSPSRHQRFRSGRT